MSEFEQLSAALENACSRLDTMIQNAESSEKKDDVSNEDKKEEEIKNLKAKIANLETRLKNAEEDEEEVKNAATAAAVKNLAGEILNILRHSGKGVKNTKEDEEEPVKNKGLKNKGLKNTDKEEKEDDPIANFAKQVANILRNACDKGEEEVKNGEDKDKDNEKTIANLLARIANLEKQVKNDDDDQEDDEDDDDKDEEEPVKNKKVKNKGLKNKELKNLDQEDKERGMGTSRSEGLSNKAVANAITGILSDMVSARQQTINNLVDTIVMNSGGMYTKEELSGKSAEELQKLSNVLTRTAVPVVDASHSNVQMDTAVVNANTALDIPSTFPTAAK